MENELRKVFFGKLESCEFSYIRDTYYDSLTRSSHHIGEGRVYGKIVLSDGQIEIEIRVNSIEFPDGHTPHFVDGCYVQVSQWSDGKFTIEHFNEDKNNANLQLKEI